MCDQEAQPATVAEALAMLHRALDHLNGADAASLPASLQAQALRALEQAGAKQVAARSRVLAAFAGQAAYEDDGQGSARAWLRWQTRITNGAAAGAVGWARRLTAHPVIGQALACGVVSESYARQLCDWTSKLPPAQQAGADEILVGAARSGVGLDGLAGLAQEMFERSRQDRPSTDDGFNDRYFRLGVTFRGAGRAEGDLTAGCTAALDAVLEALATRAGPEDLRSADQRRHDALQEACQRLIDGGLLPGRARQPQVSLHMTLSQLRDTPGASEVEEAWAAARASQPGWLTGPEAAAVACDARLAPVVTGFIDWAALDRLTGLYLGTHGLRADEPAGSTAGPAAQTAPATGTPGKPQAPVPAPLATEAPPATQAPPPACGCTCGRCSCPARTPLSPATLARLRQTMLHLAADVMSGPTGLAAALRTTQLEGPGGSRSLPLKIPIPLDTGQATPTIPASLIRAVTTRHRTCGFPGCRVPASQCHIHHLTPRSRGGPTALGNLAPLCEFHHLVAVHRWGWTLHLHPDGTTSATSPHGRTIHDHDPPQQAA